MIVIAYGVIHGAYAAIATSARNAAELGLSPESSSALAITINQAMRDMVYAPFLVFTVGFTFSVWLKRTHYPRWMLLISPIVPFLLRGVIVGHVDGSMKTIIGGGYLNLILLLFFVGSTIALSFGYGEQKDG
jgi:hypothetical protein